MISIVIAGLPPSDNHAYENVPLVRRGANVFGGGRRLTEKGRSYKVETTNHIARNYTAELRMFRQNIPYTVWCVLYFPDVENKGYPKRTDTRYKKFDGMNRTKLLFDVISELTGCDDSSFLNVVVSKRVGIERTEVLIWDAEIEAAELNKAIERFGKEA